MNEKYDYEKDLREAQIRVEDRRRQMTPKELEESEKYLEQKASELIERCNKNDIKVLKIKNEKKYQKFLRDIELLKKLANRINGILEIAIDDEEWTAKAILKAQNIIHTSDEYGDTTRYELAFLMMNYERVCFSVEEKYVAFTIHQDLYDEIPQESVCKGFCDNKEQ